MKNEEKLELEKLEDELVRKSQEKKRPMAVSGKSVFLLKKLIENRNKDQGK